MVHHCDAKEVEMQPRGSVGELGDKRTEEGKKEFQTFDVSATNAAPDSRYMGAINEFQRPLHRQSDSPDQGVNWLLTGKSDRPQPGVAGCPLSRAA